MLKRLGATLFFIGCQKVGYVKMQNKILLKDKSGNLVKSGDFVRVLNFDKTILKNLALDEQKDVNSMVGEVLEVEEIDEYGCAWVTKWWKRGDGQSESHSLSLASSDIEKIDNAR